MSDPSGFLKYDLEDQKKRPPLARVKDWKEFLLPTPELRLQKQAARCMDCGVPFCHSPPGCPVENVIPDWNDLVSRGNWKDALRSLHATNAFPEFTGRLCPAPCESACVLAIQSPDGSAAPVSIRNIELSIAERGFKESWIEPVLPLRRTGRKVAVVGSGPAGLAAAQWLARIGHEVRVYEKADRPGGLLRYGIPDFKMEKWVLDRRLGQLEAEGVRFLTGVEAGVDVSTEELRSSHDAVCLAVGAEAPRDLEITGRKLRGIHFAMDFLIQQNRRIAGEAFKPADEIAARGKRVVILGGGDTGSDCLGTVLRQSCREVRQVDIQPRPGTPRTSHAHEEGGERLWGIRTLEFIGENGWVKKLRCLDSDGGPRELPADLVLIAAGFKAPARQRLLDGLSIERDSRGNVKTDPAFMTNVPGVFAAGDAKRGASLIVWAIAEGLKMASAVDRYLTLSRVQTFSKNRSRFRKDRKA